MEAERRRGVGVAGRLILLAAVACVAPATAVASGDDRGKREDEQLARAEQRTERADDDLERVREAAEVDPVAVFAALQRKLSAEEESGRRLRGIEAVSPDSRDEAREAVARNREQRALLEDAIRQLQHGPGLTTGHFQRLDRAERDRSAAVTRLRERLRRGGREGRGRRSAEAAAAFADLVARMNEIGDRVGSRVTGTDTLVTGPMRRN